jgi:hypothetical protein
MHDPQPAHHFTDTVFEREDVRLDGNRFTRCTFGPRCRIHFFGEALPTFDQCVIAESVGFVLGGHARTTLQFLSMLYHVGGRGGTETVEGVLDQLRRGDFQ